MTSQLLTRRQSLGALAAISGVTLLGSSACGSPTPSADAAARVSVSDFGALGNGQADDTRAFQAALATGHDVFVPAAAAFYRIGRTLALSRPGQQVLGIGPRSRVVQSGVDANSDVFVTTHDDCGFHMLSLTPGAETRSLSNGWGVIIANARRCRVIDCHFTGMRRGGVLLSNAENCHVSANRFSDSLVRGDGTELQSQTGYDIFLMGSSSRNLILQNQCESGVGVGIGCQTVESGRAQSGNMIRGNSIRNQPAYGIMVYSSQAQDAIDQITIDDNSVTSISGSIRTDGRTLFYGCGIYVASANNFLISGNEVSQTNMDRRLPFSGSAVPAAIGISGFGNGTVSGNVMDSCHDGIASIQASQPRSASDRTLISDNSIRRCDHTGILLLDSVGATIRGNRMEGLGRSAQGIYAARVAARHAGGFIVDRNEISGFGVGVEIREGIPSADISANEIRGNRGIGIYCAAQVLAIRGNRISGARGITIPPTAGRGSCTDNLVQALAGAVENGRGRAVEVRGNVIAQRRS